MNKDIENVIDSAIESLASRSVRGDITYDGALKFTQAALNLANTKDRLLQSKYTKEIFRKGPQK